MPQPVTWLGMSATRVLLVCSGLEHAHRGFESFARECFEALRDEAELDLFLVKGSGPIRPGERSVPTLTREARLARTLARAWGREPFRVEQIGFGASLLPLISRRRPDVVYFSEWHTGLVLGAYRRVARQRFRLVLCNGTMAVDGFGHLDRVQQLTPAALEAALIRGDDPARHILLPLGFALSPALTPIDPDERAGLRARLRLPADRQVILSVAALNRRHKRLDYLIEEVARLPHPRPFLLLAGQEEAETEGIRALAAERLGHGEHSIRTVPQREVADLYRASDVFVLASLGEGLPRALIEALGWGLPCLAHDYAVARFALGTHGELADLSVPGALAGLLAQVVGRRSHEEAGRRHHFAYENFSWDRLRSRYVQLLAAEAVEAAGAQANRPGASGRHEPDRASIH
jgi:glycosyltransferase involved in cell wall biosynthesis